MGGREPTPGVSRQARITQEGLARLEQQLQRGVRIAQPVLEQWIRRYGEPARKLIERYRR